MTIADEPCRKRTTLPEGKQSDYKFSPAFGNSGKRLRSILVVREGGREAHLLQKLQHYSYCAFFKRESEFLSPLPIPLCLCRALTLARKLLTSTLRPDVFVYTKPDRALKTESPPQTALGSQMQLISFWYRGLCNVFHSKHGGKARTQPQLQSQRTEPRWRVSPRVIVARTTHDTQLNNYFLQFFIWLTLHTHKCLCERQLNCFVLWCTLVECYL